MDARHFKVHRGPSVAGAEIPRLLAEAAFAGIPIDRLIRSRDSNERDLLLAVHKESIPLIDKLIDKLAYAIVKEQSEAQARGAKKGR